MSGLEELKGLTEKVETVAIERQTLGEGEGILYGQAHVGHSKLSLNCSVAELHGTMHYRLRMHKHLDAVGLNAKEPFCLYHLKSLVHHRG